MGKVWVLETHTKGTGANMVPLDKNKEQDRQARASEPVFVAPKRRTVEKAPEPKKPSRFKVVDLLSDEVLAEDASARETVAVLEGVRSVVDVRVHVWNHRDERWRLLTHREQKALWDLRGRATGAPVTPSR